MKLRTYIISLFIIFSFASCSKYQKLLKSTDINKKYEQAVKYYDSKDYYRAQQLLEGIQPYYRGREKAEIIAYYICNCYYNQGDYILASYYYSGFATNFPRSQYAEECLFKSAYCKYLDSPDYNVDQSNTEDAIKGLQLFINMYPSSSRVNECNLLMDKLRLKLETKAYEVAKLYYNIEEYKAAITAFTNFLRDYPESEYKERALYYTMKAFYLYANKSIDSKKGERYQGAIDNYKKLVSVFPNTIFLREADNIFKNSSKNLVKYTASSY